MEYSTQIIGVRHSTTGWNDARRYKPFLIQGDKNVPIHLKEIDKITDLFLETRDAQIDAVYASGLMRTQDTVAPIAEYRNLNVTTMPGLNERTLGKAQGIDGGGYFREIYTSNKINEYNSLNPLQKLTYEFAPYIESDWAVWKRSKASLDQIARENPGGKVVAGMHNGVMVLLAQLLGKAPYKFNSAKIDNTGIIVFESDGKNIRILETPGLKLK